MLFDGDLIIETDDQCYTCEYVKRGIACPLLEALTEGVVKLQEDITVSRCGFYKEHKRHLNIVSGL
jgi:hypothetical protein